MTARKDSQIPRVFFCHIRQEKHGFHGNRRARIGNSDLSQRFTPIGMRIARKFFSRWSGDRLGHGQHKIGTHDVDDIVKDRRLIYQVNKGLVIAEQIASVHIPIRVKIMRVILPGIVTDRQFRMVVRLITRHAAQTVHLPDNQSHLFRIQRPLDVQITVDLPLTTLLSTKMLHRRSHCANFAHDTPGEISSKSL